jgi:hypothetical protein
MAQTRSKPLVFPSDSGMKIHLIPSAFAKTQGFHEFVSALRVSEVKKVWSAMVAGTKPWNDDQLGGKIPRKSVKNIVL